MSPSFFVTLVSNYFFSVADAPPGVYIYLGYSKKDALILQRGRVKLGKKVKMDYFSVGFVL